MRVRRTAIVLVIAMSVLSITSSAQAAWQPEQQVNDDAAAITDVAGAYVGTAQDGRAVAVWLEWRGTDGTDARLMASRRPVDGAWGTPQLVDDVTEHPYATGGRVGLNDMVVLPDGTAVLSYQEYDDEAGVDFMGRVVKLRPGGSVSDPLLNASEAQWQLTSDAEGDWLATARQYDHCACENYTYYAGNGQAPEKLGTFLGFGLRFTLSRGELVYYAVDDNDGLFQRAHTLRVVRINAATDSSKRVVLLQPNGDVSGFDIDANVSDDVALTWGVRHPEKRRLDLVRAMRHASGGEWNKPRTLSNSGGGGNRAIGAPQVETSGGGKALVAWSTPRTDDGLVNLNSTVVKPAQPPGITERLATDIDPDSPSLRFGLRVNDSGQVAVTFRHIAPCLSDSATSCHTVSALRGTIGRYRDPVVLFSSATPYETVAMALSDSGLGIVLSVESGSTEIRTRTSP